MERTEDARTVPVRRRRSTGWALGIAALVVVTAACGTAGAEPWPEPHTLGAPVGTLAPGFFDETSPPPPEGRFTPDPGSWDQVHPPADYRVVLLVGDDDDPTDAVVAAVERWAVPEHVSVKTVTATRPSQHVHGIAQAMRLHPDLIISASASTVPALDLVTASNLGTRFLTIGAQLDEPTENVTAVIWPGASSMGEHPDAARKTTYDADQFTPARLDSALRAGVAAVLNGITGYVISFE